MCYLCVNTFKSIDLLLVCYNYSTLSLVIVCYLSVNTFKNNDSIFVSEHFQE